jgi:hypothetical protein
MKKIPMLEKFAAQSLVEYEGELIFSKEKFAELIIQDCVAEVALVGISNTSFERWVGEDIAWGCSKSIECIKEHFGIKE